MCLCFFLYLYVNVCCFNLCHKKMGERIAILIPQTFLTRFKFKCGQSFLGTGSKNYLMALLRFFQQYKSAYSKTYYVFSIVFISGTFKTGEITKLWNNKTARITRANCLNLCTVILHHLYVLAILLINCFLISIQLFHSDHYYHFCGSQRVLYSVG